MNKDKQYLFGKEYFEEVVGFKNKKIYNWENTELYFSILVNVINRVLRPNSALDIGCAKGY